MSLQSNSAANRQIARAAGTVTAAFVVSQLVGLLAKIMIARAFGTTGQSDAFYAANRFTDLLFNLVAGGALASAFIPTFTGLLTEDDHPNAWRLASAVANLVLLILTVLSILAYFFAPQVVQYILAPGLAADPLTVTLLRIQLPAPIIFGLSGLIMGILNAHQHFLLPALAPSMYSLGMVFGAIVLTPSMGVRGLAWGVVVGAACHLLIQLPSLLRLPYRRYLPTLALHMPSLHEVARLMGPRLLGIAIVQLNFLLNTYLASKQPQGSLTGINLAFPLMMMPEAAIAQSIAIAALPTFSAQVARGQPDQMRSSLALTLRGVLLLTIPATLGLILLRYPLVTMLYQRGQFDAHSTDLVAWALLWYAVGLVGHCVVEIVTRAFYALRDTRTPVIIGVAAMALNLVFSLLFSSWFTSLGWMPHGGLALANTVATFLEMAGLLIVIRRRLGGLESRSIWLATGQAVLATAGMSLMVVLWMGWMQNQSAFTNTLGAVGLGGLAYLVLMVVLGVPELRKGFGLVRSLIEKRGQV